jgi:acyl-CoA synthetase (AMP-forming)/AMP-acid ligase II
MNPRPVDYGSLLDALAAAPADRTFVTMWRAEDDVDEVTFGELRARARSIAAHLVQQGLRPGDTVVLVLPQGIELMTAFVAAMWAGAVPAILAYPNAKVEPAKFRFGLAGVTANLRARLVIVDEVFPPELLEVVQLEPGSTLLRGLGARTPSDADPPPAPAGRLAFLQHSAGTTGLQKGVALSHAVVLRQLHHLSEELRIGAGDRIYSWLPLYHDMGLIACFMLPMVCHVPLVMQSPTDWVVKPATMLRLISEYRCTLAWIPNFTLQFLARRVRASERRRYDLSPVRALINCSEPVRAQSIDEMLEAFRPFGISESSLHSSYAMAENVFAVTQSKLGEGQAPRRIWVDGEAMRNRHVAAVVCRDAPGAVALVSSGPCIPGTEVKIVSETGSELPDGAVGEIAIRSDSLFDGYYNRPDLTAAVLRDGWYASGDLGLRLEGELYVVGRKKDLIIVGGKNLYPQDIEEIASSHPAIHDGRVVALGMMNPDLGTEDIVMVAEVNDAALLRDADGIEQALRAAVTAELGVAVRAVYLKPPHWVVKSTAGKPARSTTREKLLREHPELAGVRPA